MTDSEKKMNELMNKISLALKDATLQQGFEIICKRIAELEKENAELKEQLEKFKCCVNCKSFSNCYNLAMQEDENFDITCKCEKWELAE